MRGYQLRRPTIYDLEADIARVAVPALIVVGDEDAPCLEPALFLKRSMRSAGLVVLPNSGHSINLEEPDLFNRALLDFWTAAQTGTWPVRETA
jgi:pimeloyl-ACP methyl ester carboxylesterase